MIDSLMDLIHQVLDPEALIRWAGYGGLVAIVFAETGLLFGFFLPGDSLLVTAGLLSAPPLSLMNVYVLGVILSIAAIVGDAVGYSIGKATGPRIFTRENSLLFNKKHLVHAQNFYERHGKKTIVIARFVPIVRTFAPVVAGVAQMRYRDFVIYNVFGGLLWVWSMLFTGYILGRYVPGVTEHIEKVIILVIFLSILPGIISWLRAKRVPGAVSGS
jgi:membrane-associated protein